MKTCDEPLKLKEFLFFSLNEIRLCAPISLAPSIISRIEEVLISAVHTLRDREARFGKSSIETEKATFQQLVLIFCQVCIIDNFNDLFKDCISF